jgi:hypothetical protein
MRVKADVTDGKLTVATTLEVGAAVVVANTINEAAKQIVAAIEALARAVRASS